MSLNIMSHFPLKTSFKNYAKIMSWGLYILEALKRG